VPGSRRAPAVHRPAGEPPETSTGFDTATPSASRVALLSSQRRRAGDPRRSPRWTLKTALGRVSPISYGRRSGAPQLMSRGAPRVEAELGRFGARAAHRQDIKGARWMPWHQETRKDVDGCDKPR
jgi:hypothetical protein